MTGSDTDTGPGPGTGSSRSSISSVPPASESPKVKIGTLLLTARPFAYVLSTNLQLTQTYCDTCFKQKSDESEALFRCASCHLVYYCDRTCQKAGWEDGGHKWECGPFSILRQVPPGFSRLLYRVLSKLQTTKRDIYDRVDAKIPSRRWRDLMSHYPEIKADPSRMEQIYCSGKVVESLMRHAKGLVVPNETELLITCGKILVNTFSITDPELQQVGTGLYLGPSIFDHSCTPMAVATFQSTTIQIRNVLEFPTNTPLHKVTICYRDALRPTVLRQADLRTGYYFTCQCRRCTNPKLFENELRVFQCNSCHCDIYVDKLGAGGDTEFPCQPNTMCVSCGTELSTSRLEKLQETESMVQSKLDEMHEIQYLDVAETCIKLMRADGFAELHWQMVAMAISAFESALEMKLWKKGLEYGRLALKGYRKFLSSTPIHPLLGITVLKLAKLCWFMEREEEAKEYIVEAKFILSLTHGPASPFMIHTIQPLAQEILTTMSMRKL